MFSKSAWIGPGTPTRCLRSPSRLNAAHPASPAITVFAGPPDAAKLAPYREAGIERVLFEVPDKSRDEVLAVLDANAKLIAKA